jgi:predicted hotdog family 3-hydroxylacyl-ACP dehydratase
MLNGEALCARLPHAAPMCLLDELIEWDAASVLCRTRTHQDSANPLRRDGRLAAIHAIEYACQAAALHSALAPRAGRSGEAEVPRALLAAVKDVRFAGERLDAMADPLQVAAWRELTLGPSAIYGFRIECGGRTLAEGRLTVVGGGEA